MRICSKKGALKWFFLIFCMIIGEFINDNIDKPNPKSGSGLGAMYGTIIGALILCFVERRSQNRVLEGRELQNTAEEATVTAVVPAPLVEYSAVLIDAQTQPLSMSYLPLQEEIKEVSFVLQDAKHTP